MYTARRIAPDHCDFDFAGASKSSARNFRSAQLENGIERKRRTIFTRGRRVGEVAGRDMSLANQCRYSRELRSVKAFDTNALQLNSNQILWGGFVKALIRSRAFSDARGFTLYIQRCAQHLCILVYARSPPGERMTGQQRSGSRRRRGARCRTWPWSRIIELRAAQVRPTIVSSRHQHLA